MRAASDSTVSSGSTGTAACSDDRPGVELLGDEVHRAARHLHAVRQRLPLRVDARERRQQRRVDVEDRRAETRSTNTGPSSRMNPARQTRPTRGRATGRRAPRRTRPGFEPAVVDDLGDGTPASRGVGQVQARPAGSR